MGLDRPGAQAPLNTTVRCAVSIARPPEAVASILLDENKAVLWTSGLQRFEVVDRPPGLVGSKARLHYLEGGRSYIMEDLLLEVEPNRRFLSRVTGDAIEAEVETTLEPAPDGTVVTVRWSGRGRRLLVRLLLPFMRGAIKRQTIGDLMKLKALVESG